METYKTVPNNFSIGEFDLPVVCVTNVVVQRDYSETFSRGDRVKSTTKYSFSCRFGQPSVAYPHISHQGIQPLGTQAVVGHITRCKAKSKNKLFIRFSGRLFNLLLTFMKKLNYAFSG